MGPLQPTDVDVLGLVEALRHVPAAVDVVDRTGRVLYANDRARELAERLGGEMPERDSAVLRSITSGKSLTDEVFEHVLPDGERLVLRCSSAPVRDAGGRIVAGVLVSDDVTALRRHEERLTSFDRLLDTTDDGIVGTDAAFRVTVWNPGAERLYGYAAEEVLGRPAREVASFEGDTARRRLEASLLETDRVRLEFTARRKDGSHVEVEMHAVAVRDGRGTPVGYLGIHRDVSARKRAERVTRRLASIVEHSADFIGIADSDGRGLFLNDAGRRMVGFGERDIRATSLLDFFAPSDRAYVRDEVLPTIAQRGRWRAETELCLRHFVTGELIPVLWDTFRIDDPGTGEPMAIATVTRDITERRRAEQEREARARQQAAVAALGVRALEEGDPQVVMDEAVAAVARTLGVEQSAVAEILPESEELVLRSGVGWQEGLVGRATGSAGRGSLVGYTVMTGEPVVSADVQADERFGLSGFVTSHRPASAVAVVIAGTEGPFGVLVAFTSAHRAFLPVDVDFMQSVANVISVAFETARTEERVRDVRDAERRRIARDLHDEALQGLTEALVRAGRLPDAAGAAELAGGLRRVAEQLRAAIYDLRLGDDEHLPFAARLDELVSAHGAMATGVELEADIADGMPALLGDRGTEVLRIVGEAITNARRHAGASTIRVSAWASGACLHVQVADDGAGLPDADEPAPGRSAGLRGIRERADLLGADLDISAAAGGGTVVGLELPAGDRRGAEPGVGRILLVEDHTSVREAIAEMFEREPDFTVVGQAGSLTEARGMLEGVDVALVDLGLPDGFGADLIGELRAIDRRAVAVVLSAGLDRTTVARALRAGAAGTIDKTARIDDVVDTVRRVRAGEAVLPPAEVVDLLRFDAERREQEAADRTALDRLTVREREVLQALADGLGSQAIAERLHITRRTERNHFTNILAKLGVHSRLQALVFALRYGVVEIR